MRWLRTAYLGVAVALSLLQLKLLIGGNPQGDAKPERVTMRYSADALGRRRYKLIVSADASTVLGMARMPLQFSANIDIEAGVKRQTRSGELIMDVSVVGGVMRLFGQGWRQVDRVGSHTVTITMTPSGQILAVKGLAAGDAFEAAAGLDVVSLAVGTLCVGLPDKPVGVGDVWQIEHYIGGKNSVVTHTRLSRLSASPSGQTIAHLETEYDLPIDWLIPIEFKAWYGVRAHHKGATQVNFNCHAGCVEEASGTVEIEVNMSVPIEELPPDLIPSIIAPDLNAPGREQQGGARGKAADDGGAKETDKQDNEPQGAEGEMEGGDKMDEGEVANEGAPPKTEGAGEMQIPRRVPMSIMIRAEFQLVKLD